MARAKQRAWRLRFGIRLNSLCNYYDPDTGKSCRILLGVCRHLRAGFPLSLVWSRDERSYYFTVGCQGPFLLNALRETSHPFSATSLYPRRLPKAEWNRLRKQLIAFLAKHGIVV